MEPEQQPMEVHDPSKILNAPQPADDYGAATRASVLAGHIPAEEQGEKLEVPPEGSLATEEVDKGPGEAMAEAVSWSLCGLGLIRFLSTESWLTTRL